MRTEEKIPRNAQEKPRGWNDLEYQDYVEDAKAAGDVVMTYDQWIATL